MSGVTRWKIWLDQYDQPCEERPYGVRQIEVVAAKDYEDAEKLAVAVIQYLPKDRRAKVIDTMLDRIAGKL